MKKYTLPFSLLFILQYATAQHCGTASGPGACTSLDTISRFGFAPTYNQLQPFINGQPVDLTLQFQAPDTVYLGAGIGEFYVDAIVFDTISKLPAGLCWSSSAVDDSFTTQQDGCFSISGIPCDTPGQYKLYLHTILYGVNYSIVLPVAAESYGFNYFLRLNNVGEATIAVDTAQRDTGAFIKYGPAQNCTAPSIIVSLNGGAVCHNSSLAMQVNVTYGVGPYHYNWSATGGTLSCDTCPSPQITITDTTVVSVTVTDSRDSMGHTSATYTVNADTNHISTSFTNTGITCTSITDTTVATASDVGFTHFNYTWGDGSSDSAVTSPRTHHYTQPGIYEIMVSDSNHCATSKPDTVPNHLLVLTFASATQPGCYGQTTGMIAISVTGGTPPYNYNWNDGGSLNDTLRGITEGTYSVTVMDAGVCSATFSYTLNAVHDNSGFYPFLTATQSNCSNNGAVTDTVYGGIAPLHYLWSNTDTSRNISSLSGGNYSVTVTDSASCTVSGTAYVYSSCYGIISGVAFVDANSNCIFDSGESPVMGIMIIAVAEVNSDTFFGITDYSGNYYMQVSDTGKFYMYTVPYSPACGDLILCNNTSQTVHIAALGDTSDDNKFVAQGSQGFDLTLYPAWNSADPGFQKEYDIYPGNQSYTMYNGPDTVVFVFDTNLIYQFSIPAPTAYDSATRTLTWILSSVGILDTLDSPTSQSFFKVPSTLSLSTLLQSDFRIYPARGDCDTSNNHLHFSEIVTGSNDPNEKDVSPAGSIAQDDSLLTYTIHFQNTGTDSTHFIVVKDTLSPNLDPATVYNLAASSKYSSFTVTGKGILTWTFNPYALVDSITNPGGSKGFVMFSVKKKSTLPVGATISNTASVYFDYNSPVVTNTVTDTVSNPLGIFEVSNVYGITVKAFPNPFSNTATIVVTGLDEKYDFNLYDITGRLQQSVPSITVTQFEISRNGLSQGIYLYRLSVNNSQVACGRLVVE